MAAQEIAKIVAHIESVFHGKSDLVELTLAALLANGHILLEDVPGVGKTTLALALARALGLEFRRVQFTSDLLPADILGVSVWVADKSEFSFRPGPVFSNVVLADEINRTTPRTQSALLEAMSERRVSVDDTTHALPDPFLVIATQNPLEHHGTYPLPESQLDRFLMRLSVGYPVRDVELTLLTDRRTEAPVDQLPAVTDAQSFKRLQAQVDTVHLGPEVAGYLLDVVTATRRDARVRMGVSTRGVLAIGQACRAWALMRGRDFVTPDDARKLIVPCLSHRLSLTGSLGEDRETAEATMEEIASRIPVPT
ncbi:MAG: MoxR family ATPase [bacterium]